MILCPEAIWEADMGRCYGNDIRRRVVGGDSLADAGATLLYLPPYSPGFNPIEMAFSKLKALLRKAAARTVDDLSDAIANAIDAFTPSECENYFAAAGYERN